MLVMLVMLVMSVMSEIIIITDCMNNFDFGALREHDMCTLKKLTSDDKLLFELDIQNCFNEIEDIYSTLPTHTKSVSTAQTKKTILIAYRIYLDSLITNPDPSNQAQHLEILSKLLSAVTYHMVGKQDKENNVISGAKSYQFYETRWEPDEIICFLLTYSSYCDDDAKKELNVLNYPPQLHLIIWKAYCILKNSITLSECATNEDFLQCKHTLRYPSSHIYWEFAQSIDGGM